MKQTLKDLLQKFEYFWNTSIFNFACFFLAHPVIMTMTNVSLGSDNDYDSIIESFLIMKPSRCNSIIRTKDVNRCDTENWAV